MKKLIVSFLCCVVVEALIFINPAIAAPTAVCVPWKPSDQTLPHYTFSGAEITLKGIARDNATEYRWDFGDGGSSSWTAITNPYNLGIKHIYNGVVGQLFIATLHVRDSSANEDRDEYPVQIFESSDLSKPNQLEVRINMAIDEGLWWLHTNMIRATYPGGSPGYGQPYGYWDPGYYPVASTGTSVDAFQLHGSRPNTDYNSDPYVETVQRALNYLLVNTYSYAIGPQPAGNPDTSPNGIGLVTNQSGDLYDSRQTYIGGICMAALASSKAPNIVASVGGANVYNRTYGEIVQDMVDFFAWGQVDSGSGRGGWRYYANFSDSDMSTTQWPPLGMVAAIENMGSIVPQFVRDELTSFLIYTQYTGLDNDNGGFGYNSPTSMLNITKVAAGIISHEFLGTPFTDPKVQSAIGYIYRHWNDTGTGWDDTQLHGNSYGMYGVMKALRIPEPDITRVTEYDYNTGNQTGNSFDWYYTPSGQTQQGLASYIVSTQQADGSWDDVVGPNAVYDAFCTGWRLLTLLKVVTIPKPTSVICYCDEQEYNLWQDINLNGSCSFHDPTRHIVSYEWDFEYDFLNFVTDATGVLTTIVGGYSQEGFYPVALRVTDDNPAYLGGPQSDIYVCAIWVHPPPHCPHAYSGGPYIGWIGSPVSLDASASWDPDNPPIASYEWDLDYDGLFGTDDHDCFGQPSDAVGEKPQWTWSTLGLYPIGLKVTDNEVPYGSCPDYDYTTVDIGNHEPIANSGGPYTAIPEATITLDGSGSSDPDPGDTITFAWDLDNDGQFDDCGAIQCQFTVGQQIGFEYTIGLQVSDNHDEYDRDYTKVTIVEKNDIDRDDVSDETDNCPTTPNGPDLGTCTIGNIGASCTSNEQCGTGGYCSMNQEDFDLDGLGDVCDNCPAITNEGQEDADLDDVGNVCDNCPAIANGGQENSDLDNLGDSCDNCPAITNEGQKDADRDTLGDACDNCPLHSNRGQEDNYPPGGNGIGDACECEADFECNGNVDGLDVATFKLYFGRGTFNAPCNTFNPCRGDFDCNGNVDGLDAARIMSDFGRSSINNPCPPSPPCSQPDWCNYPD